MSAMLSAPATIPATSDPIFQPVLAPLSVGTHRCSSSRVSGPDRSANATTGASPVVDTRFGPKEPRTSDGSGVR